MCIIAVKPAKVKISEDTFKKCFDNNSDGCGFMYAHEGKIFGVKGLMTFDDFKSACKTIPDDCCVVYHFRIQTHGGVVSQLTHPYPVTDNVKELHNTRWCCEDYGVAHNGIFSISDVPSGESDTTMWIKDRLNHIKRLAKYDNSSLLDEKYEDVITSLVGSGSKVAIMDTEGYVKMYGSGWIADKSGAYFSNTSYSYSKSYSYGYSGNYGGTYHYNKTYSTDYTSKYDSAFDDGYIEGLDYERVTVCWVGYDPSTSSQYVDKDGNMYVWDKVWGLYKEIDTPGDKSKYKEHESFVIKVMK